MQILFSQQELLSELSSIIHLIGLISISVAATVFSLMQLRLLVRAYFDFIDNRAIFVAAALSVISGVIGAAISNNIYLGLGMLGALSIIRFRTPIRSAAEISTIFFAVTAGISVNASHLYPLVLSLATLVLAVCWRLFDSNSRIIGSKYYVGAALSSGEIRELIKQNSLSILVTTIGSHADGEVSSNYILSGASKDVETFIDYLSRNSLLRDSTRVG